MEVRCPRGCGPQLCDFCAPPGTGNPGTWGHQNWRVELCHPHRTSRERQSRDTPSQSNRIFIAFFDCIFRTFGRCDCKVVLFTERARAVIETEKGKPVVKERDLPGFPVVSTVIQSPSPPVFNCFLSASARTRFAASVI
jgi:hypothetical protein